MDQSSQLSIVLLTPPCYYFANALAGPRLLSALHVHGVAAVHYDLDHALYSFLFNETFLNNCLIRFQDKHFTINPGALEEFIGFFSYTKKILLQQGILNNSLDVNVLMNFLKGVIPRIAQAQNVLNEKFLSLSKSDFINYFTWIEVGSLIVSLGYFPTRLDLLDGMTMRFNPHREKDIIAASESNNENYLIKFYQEKVIPAIKKLNPQCIGISMNFFSQFIPGFTLARLIKEQCKNTYIVIGGATITTIHKLFVRQLNLWDWIDSIIVSYGEKTLPLLVESILNKTDVNHVPNLIYKNTSHAVHITQLSDTLNPEEMPYPLFDDSRPRPILSLQTSFGCDYGKCAFCHYPYANECADNIQKPHYRVASIEKVVDHISRLVEEKNPRMIFLVDSNIPARRLGHIAQEIVKKKIRIKYFSFMRAEKQFASQSFCCLLRESGYVAGFMGLEAANQRVNTLMRKNVDLSLVQNVMQSFSKADIILNIFCIVGFPGETKEEALETRNFIKENLYLLKGEISIAPFRLGMDTYISQHLDEYGVTIVPRVPEEDFYADYDYAVQAGLSQQETDALVKQFYRELGIKYFSGKTFFEVLGKK